MPAPTNTRAWRGWLYASLPPMFLYGPALLSHAASVLARHASGMPWQAEINVHIPAMTRITMGWTAVTPLILSGLFFRWGKYGRAPVKSSLVLGALPWLVGSLNVVAPWHGTVDLLSLMGGFATAAAGASERLDAQAVTAAASALLCASVGVASLLDVMEVGVVAPKGAARRSRSTPFAGVLAGVALAGVASAALATLAGGGFLHEVAASGLSTWSSESDALAARWGWLQLAHWALVVAALLPLGGLALASHRPPLRSATRWLAAILLLSHAAHAGAQRHVLAALARISQAGGFGAPSGPLFVPEGESLEHELRPSVSASRAGLYLPGSGTVPWSVGHERLGLEIRAHQQRERLIGGDPPSPAALAVAVEGRAPLASIACLVLAAKGTGTNQLLLGTGPEHEIPASTRTALSRASPALELAFAGWVSMTRVTLADRCGGEPGPGHDGSLVLSPASAPEEDEFMRKGPHGSHWDCIQLRLGRDATLEDFFRFVRGAGRNAKLVFDVDPASVCGSH